MVELTSLLCFIVVLVGAAIFARMEKIQRKLFNHIATHHQDIWDELELNRFDDLGIFERIRFGKYFNEEKYKEKKDDKMDEMCNDISKLETIITVIATVALILGCYVIFAR